MEQQALNLNVVNNKIDTVHYNVQKSFDKVKEDIKSTRQIFTLYAIGFGLILVLLAIRTIF